MHLSVNELAARLVDRPGLIPTAIDALRKRTLWVDWNGYHCYEGFFNDSLAMYTTLLGGKPSAFSSPLDSLLSPAVISAIRNSCMEPTGFIFHAGRCGSTLIVKALGRCRKNLVFGEAAPHNQIWQAIGDTDPAIETYRNLLILMGRKRLPSHTAHIVKFTSFNIVQYPFIREAFPRVPAVFLFREPGGILQSCRRTAPAWLGRDLGIGKTWDTVESAIEDFFLAALAVDEPGFHCLDYQDLSAGILPAILRLFHLDPAPAELQLMKAEFASDAKSLAPRPFLPASPTQSPTPARLIDLYARLRRRAPVTA